MLLEILDYLRRESIASNQQLAREFKMDTAALQPMLDFWLKKQVIICCQRQSSCKSACFKCAEPAVYYQFCTTDHSC